MARHPTIRTHDEMVNATKRIGGLILRSKLRLAAHAYLDANREELQADPRFSEHWAYIYGVTDDALVSELGLLFDEQRQSVGLWCWLSTMHHALQTDPPGIGLKSTVKLDQLAAAVTNVTGKGNALVAKLRKTRNDYSAHSGEKITLGRLKFPEEDILTEEDLANLVSLAWETFHSFASTVGGYYLEIKPSGEQLMQSLHLALQAREGKGGDSDG